MKILISNTSENPLYQQIKDQIKDAILKEELVEGDPLPSIRAFANDLSVSVLTIRRVYEELEKSVDRDVIYQYIQHRTAAKDFANYLELYYKYKTDYKVGDLLEGKWDAVTLQKIRSAPFDEHLSIISLLNGKLGGLFRECYEQDAYVGKLYGYLTRWRDSQEALTLEDIQKTARRDLKEQKCAELLTKEQEHTMIRVIDTLTRFTTLLKGDSTVKESDKVREMFGEEKQELDILTDHISKELENAFLFLEAAFGESQEMVAFVTELNANYYGIWFIQENGCDLYYRYNKGLLFDERRQGVIRQMDEMESMFNLGIR